MSFHEVYTKLSSNQNSATYKAFMEFKERKEKKEKSPASPTGTSDHLFKRSLANIHWPLGTSKAAGPTAVANDSAALELGQIYPNSD